MASPTELDQEALEQLRRELTGKPKTIPFLGSGEAEEAPKDYLIALRKEVSGSQQEQTGRVGEHREQLPSGSRYGLEGQEFQRIREEVGYSGEADDPFEQAVGRRRLRVPRPGKEKKEESPPYQSPTVPPIAQSPPPPLPPLPSIPPLPQPLPPLNWQEIAEKVIKQQSGIIGQSRKTHLEEIIQESYLNTHKRIIEKNISKIDDYKNNSDLIKYFSSPKNIRKR